MGTAEDIELINNLKSLKADLQSPELSPEAIKANGEAQVGSLKDLQEFEKVKGEPLKEGDTFVYNKHDPAGLAVGISMATTGFMGLLGTTGFGAYKCYKSDADNADETADVKKQKKKKIKVSYGCKHCPNSYRWSLFFRIPYRLMHRPNGNLGCRGGCSSSRNCTYGCRLHCRNV